MSKAIKVLIIIIAVLLLAFAAYVGYSHIMHQKDLREYPFRYVSLIREYSEKYSLDPYLVLSIMRCESSLESDAISPKGARGLMQIMPDTGEWIAHKLDLDDIYTEEMLFEPERNIEFSCWFLNFLSGRFDKNMNQIVCAYNAGHKTVQNWLENPEYAAEGELTKIPFPDTEKYLNRVLTAYSKYRELYPELFDAVE